MKRKYLALFMALLMLAGMLAACGGSPSSTTPAPGSTGGASTGGASTGGDGLGEAPFDIFSDFGEEFPVEEYIAYETAKWNLGRDKVTELYWYVNWGHHSTPNPWTDYKSLAIASGILGIDVIGQIPAGDPTESVQLMMANNSFPDIVTLGYGDPLGQQLINDGYLLCMEDVLKEYEPEFFATLEPNIYNFGLAEDGKMWSLNGGGKSQAEIDRGRNLGSRAYAVRKDIWEEMGSPSIATPDELFDVLMMFKEMYPTLGGKQSIAVGTYERGYGPIHTFGDSFGVNDLYVHKDGSVEPKEVGPGYADMLVYWNKLARNGLMDPEFFSRDNQSAIEGYATNTFMCPWVYHAPGIANDSLYAENPESVFVAIPPMSATGEPYNAAGSPPSGHASTYISANCTDLEAVARLFAYAFSPTGTMQINRGTPGVQWQVVDGEWTWFPEVKLLQDTDQAAYNQEWGLWGYHPVWYPYLLQKVEPPTNRRAEINEEFNLPNTDPYSHDPTIETYMMQPVKDSVAGVAKAVLDEIGNRERARIVFEATSEEEAREWAEQMQANMRAVKDYDQLCAFLTERYNLNKETFGEPAYGTIYVQDK